MNKKDAAKKVPAIDKGRKQYENGNGKDICFFDLIDYTTEFCEKNNALFEEFIDCKFNPPALLIHRLSFPAHRGIKQIPSRNSLRITYLHILGVRHEI